MPLPSTMSLMVARPPAASSLITGLQVYYALEDATESSGTGLTLTNNNSVTFSAGKIGNAANFTASSSQSLSHATNTAYDWDASHDLTLSMWIKFTASATRAVCYGALNTTAGYGFRLTDQIKSIVYDGTTQVTVTSASTYDDGNWHLVIMTLNRSGNMTLYVDNGSVGTPTSITAVGAIISRSFYIGQDADNLFMDGSIDEVGLWNRVLTSTELTTLWNSGNGKTYPFS